VYADVHPEQPVKKVPKVVSSCPAGTKLNGLNYFKNKPDVFAREDEEYPEWLWGLLEEFESKKKAQDGGVDPSSMFLFSSVDGSFRNYSNWIVNSSE